MIHQSLAQIKVHKFFPDLSVVPSRRRAAIWQSVGGGLANCIIIVQGFLLIPLYIHYLGADLYGYWLATGGVLAWFSMVDIGGDAVARQRCAHAYGMRDFQRMVDYFWHGLIVTSGVVTVFFFILLTFANNVPVFIDAEKSDHPLLTNCLRIAGFATVLNLLEMFFRGFCSAAQRTFVPVLGNAFGLLIGLVVTILGLTYFNWGLYALVFAAIVRAMIPLGVNIIYCGALLLSAPHRCFWSKAIFKDYCITTPSVFAAKAANVFSSQLPAVLLTKWYGPDVTVSYTVIMRLLGVIGNFINQPIGALSATSAHFFGDRKVDEAWRKEVFIKIAKGFLFTAGTSYLGFAMLNHGFILLWVTDVHYLGWGFSVLAAFGSFLMLRNSIYSNIIISSGAIRAGGYLASLEKLVVVGLQFALIFLYSALGAALSVVMATLLMQIPYHLLLRHQSRTVADSLISLQFMGLPLGVLLLIGSLLAPFFIFDNWVEFVVSAALVLFLILCIVIGSIADLRLRFIDKLKLTLLKAVSNSKAA